jgi:prepilin signal peptidase PulO-like enzyme (type II secretory pathway)
MATHRLPNREEIVFKRSHCPKCGRELQKKSLIPIVSYLLQKGRCLECGEKINPRYFIIELINTFSYILIFLIFGACPTTFYLCFLFSLLLMITIIDLEHYEIPEYTQILLGFFAILHILFNPIDPLYALFCALMYFAIIELVRIITEKIKKREVLGGGDTKLITICGFFLGIKVVGIFLFTAGVFGVIFSVIWKLLKKTEVFPFAPAIVMSLFILIIKYYMAQ